MSKILKRKGEGINNDKICTFKSSLDVNNCLGLAIVVGGREELRGSEGLCWRFWFFKFSFNFFLISFNSSFCEEGEMKGENFGGDEEMEEELNGKIFCCLSILSYSNNWPRKLKFGEIVGRRH